MSNQLCKPIIKASRIVKRATITTLALCMLFLGTLCTREMIDNLNYTSQTVIQENFQNLEIHSPYVSIDKLGKYSRLANNGSEPIYVSFDQNYKTHPEFKEKAIKSLDYIFGMVGQINPLYRYEVVSRARANAESLLGKSVIMYDVKNFESTGFKDSDGVEVKRFNLNDAIYWDHIYTKNIIYVDFDKFNNYDENYVNYIYTHELMHAFGFSDVYKNYMVQGVLYSDDLTRYRGDTYMQRQFGESMKIITPKDYATICALYMQKSRMKDKAYLEEIKQKILDYEQYYYNLVDERCFQELQRYYIADKLTPRLPDENLDKFSFSRFSINWDEDGQPRDVYKTRLDVEIKNGTYNIKLYDEKGNYLDGCKGEVTKTEHFIVLKNCAFKNGISPLNAEKNYQDGFVEDICIWENYYSYGAILNGSFCELNEYDPEDFNEME